MSLSLKSFVNLLMNEKQKRKKIKAVSISDYIENLIEADYELHFLW